MRNEERQTHPHLLPLCHESNGYNMWLKEEGCWTLGVRHGGAELSKLLWVTPVKYLTATLLNWRITCVSFAAHVCRSVAGIRSLKSGVAGLILYPGGLILTAVSGETAQLWDRMKRVCPACTPSPLTVGRRFNHAGYALIPEPSSYKWSRQRRFQILPALERWQVQVAATVWCHYTAVSLCSLTERG